MVFWEITVVTAYFLGLKRTFQLALRIQRRLIGPNHPKLRDFVHRIHDTKDGGLEEILTDRVGLGRLSGDKTEGRSSFSGLRALFRWFPRRTRNIFDVALSVHRNIQQRDIDVGKSLGNKILRWLDRMKPSAQIRRECTRLNYQESPAAKPTKDPRLSTGANGIMNRKITGRDSDGRMLASPMNIRLLKPGTNLGMMLPPHKAVDSSSSHCRHIYGHAQLGYGRCDDVFRRDIAEWMKR